jgi:hypothetical protein
MPHYSGFMAQKKKPTVKEGGIAIRIPTRVEFFGNLKKAAKPPSRPRRAPKKSS